jgi:uncharacterized protein (PEP-CTERM system associated)
MRLPLALLPAAAAGTAWAADIQWTPSFGITSLVTDNARGTTKATPDLLTTLTPGLDVTGTGDRIAFDLGYQLNSDTYLKAADLDALRHNLVANGHADLVPETLRIEASAFAAQVSTSQAGPVAATPRALGTNQTDTFGYTIGPVLTFHAGADTTATLSYQLGQSFFSQSGAAQTPGTQPASDSTSHDIAATLARQAEDARLAWTVDVKDQIAIQATDTVTTRTAELDPHYALSRGLSLIGFAGWEDIRHAAAAGSVGGPFYQGGVELTPGPSTKLKLYIGKRYGVLTPGIEFNRDITSRSTLTAAYTETVSQQESVVQNSVAFAVRDPATGAFIDSRTGLPFSVQGAAAASLTSSVVRTQSATVTLAVQGDLTTLTATAFRTVQQPVLTGGTPSPTETDLGQTLNLSRTLSEKATATLGVSTTASHVGAVTGTPATDSLRLSASAGLTYALNDTLSASCLYSHLSRFAPQTTAPQTTAPQTAAATGTTGGTTHENVISVTLRKTF